MGHHHHRGRRRLRWLFTAAYGQADAKCNAVYAFLSKEAGYDPASGTNSALRTTPPMRCGRSTTGPGSCRRSTPSGEASFVPNPHYSGPARASLSKFVEVPFATEDDEYSALTRGRLTFGYLPLSRVTKPTTNPITPTGYSPLLSGYYLAPLYTWSVDYFPENFNSTGDGGNAGSIWKQLYFRQALQDLIDQPRAIAEAYKGFGVPTYGPVPLTPATPYVSRLEKNNPYPYSVSKAKTLLTSHGWRVVPNGTTSCTRPGAGAGECGKDIPAGAQLAFNLEFDSGDRSMESLMQMEKASWAQVGIEVTLSEAPFDTVIGDATACRAGPACTWELENWGAGGCTPPTTTPPVRRTCPRPQRQTREATATPPTIASSFRATPAPCP